jgi:hypothetical protein
MEENGKKRERERERERERFFKRRPTGQRHAPRKCAGDRESAGILPPPAWTPRAVTPGTDCHKPSLLKPCKNPTMPALSNKSCPAMREELKNPKTFLPRQIFSLIDTDVLFFNLTHATNQEFSQSP